MIFKEKMKKILTTLLTASTIVVGSALIAPSAEAACISAGNCTITLDGTDYEISTLLLNFNSNQEQLEAQPWFGSESLALSATTQVGVGLGAPNTLGIFGPFFAYEAREVGMETDFVSVGTVFGPNFVISNFVNPQDFAHYAIATEVEQVPEPLTILGTITFGGFIAGMKKRRNEQN